MKTVYMKYNSAVMLSESTLRNELPEFIVNDIRNNKTAFGKNMAFPDIYDCPFLEKIYSSKFNDVISNLKSLKKIDIVKSSNVNSALCEIIEMCKKEETPYRAKLEALCAKIVIKLFNVPQDSVNIETKLTDSVELNSNIIQLDKIDDEDEFNTIDDIKNFKMELNKREIINALNFGYGMHRSRMLKTYVSEIYEISPKLVELYHMFFILNDYVLFTNTLRNMTENHNLQIGTVEVKLSQIDECPVITSQGLIFPVLLSETIRGFMELFASHGFPKDKKLTSNILKRTDYLKAEPWYMRTGPILWDIILKQIDENIKGDMLPYIYKRICCLDIENFNEFMTNVLSQTKRGKKMISIIIQKALEDKNSEEKIKQMDSPSTHSYMITDNFIREEEL